MKNKLFTLVLFLICATQTNGADTYSNEDISKAIEKLGANSRERTSAMNAQNIAWHLKRANQGEAESQYLLGFMYELGSGARQNYATAFGWYQKAANQDYVKAQYRLGTMYDNGKGVRQNRVIAKEWYGKACDNGNQDGCDGYKLLNQRGY